MVERARFARALQMDLHRRGHRIARLRPAASTGPRNIQSMEWTQFIDVLEGLRAAIPAEELQLHSASVKVEQRESVLLDSREVLAHLEMIRHPWRSATCVRWPTLRIGADRSGDHRGDGIVSEVMHAAAA